MEAMRQTPPIANSGAMLYLERNFFITAPLTCVSFETGGLFLVKRSLLIRLSILIMSFLNVR